MILLYRALGALLLGLGFVGLFVPLLPTTVFVIAAAYCFARSSPSLYARLLRHPRFGPYIKNWEERRAMPRSAKRIALAFTTAGAALAIFAVPSLFARVAVLLVALGLVLVLLRIPVYDGRGTVV